MSRKQQDIAKRNVFFLFVPCYFAYQSFQHSGCRNNVALHSVPLTDACACGRVPYVSVNDFVIIVCKREFIAKSTHISSGLKQTLAEPQFFDIYPNNVHVANHVSQKFAKHVAKQFHHGKVENYANNQPLDDVDTNKTVLFDF